MENKKSIYYPGMFDLVKGICILSILISHSITLFGGQLPRNLSEFTLKDVMLLLFNIVSLGNAVIPLFFMVSGIGFAVTEMKKCVKKQIKYLIKPYLLTAIITVCLHLCIHYCFFHYFPASLRESLKLLASFCLGLSTSIQIAGTGLFFIGAAWFIVALFLSLILLNAILSKVSGKYAAGLILFLVVCGRILGNIVKLPFCIEQSLVCLGYLYMGYQIKKHNLLSAPLSPVVWGIMVLLAVVDFFFGDFSIADAIWNMGMIDIVGAGCAAFLVLRLAVRMNHLEFVWLDKIRMAGRYSLWIICIHTVEWSALPWYLFVDVWKEHPVPGLFLMILIRGILIYAVCRTMIWYNRYRKKKRRKQKKNV